MPKVTHLGSSRVLRARKYYECPCPDEEPCLICYHNLGDPKPTLTFSDSLEGLTEKLFYSQLRFIIAKGWRLKSAKGKTHRVGSRRDQA